MVGAAGVSGAVVVPAGVAVGAIVVSGGATVGVPAVGEGVTLGKGVRGLLTGARVGAGVGGLVSQPVIVSTREELTVQTRASSPSLR